MSARDHLVEKRIRDRNGRETTVHVLPKDANSISMKFAPFTVVDRMASTTIETPEGYLAMSRAVASELRAAGRKPDMIDRSVVEDDMHERTRMLDTGARASVLLTDARGLDEDQRLDREDAIAAFRADLSLAGLGLVDHGANSGSALLIGGDDDHGYFGHEEDDSTEECPRYRVTEVIPLDRVPHAVRKVIDGHLI